jgi:hypothetical protein
VNNIRQTKMHTPEPSVPEPNSSRVEIAVDQIQAELIKAGGNRFCSEVHRLINSV